MALNGTMVKIETVTVGSGGAANITFSNIPQTYTDLKVVISTRDSGSGSSQNLKISFNGVGGTSYSSRLLYGDGSSASSFTLSSAAALEHQYSTAAGATASTFGSTEVYVPNYTSSTNKSVSVDSVTENNATGVSMGLSAGLFSNTSAITSITLAPFSGSNTFVQHSTATLYGISRTTAQIKATGGMIYDDADYVYHLFTSSGTFTPAQNLSVDYLIVAGGGGGGAGLGGGGGAGGYRTGTGSSVTANTAYTITVGAGGNGSTNTANASSAGNNSSALSITSAGGGNSTGQSVGFPSGPGGGSGGSGGGGARNNTAGGAGNTPTATPSQGNNGGSGSNDSSGFGGGGGGGAGAAGGNGSGTAGGAGGAGSDTSSAFSTATSTGVSGFYAGGGGGGVGLASGSAAGGSGGGGAGGNNNVAGSNGTANTGGGGGGGGENSSAGKNGGNGGSGVVIIRYNK